LKGTRFLGVTKNLYQEIDTSGIRKKLDERIRRIASSTNSPLETRTSHNSLVVSVANYSPLCIHFSLEEMYKIDRKILESYKRNMGFITPDMKHPIFINRKDAGHGLRSLTVEYLIAKIRETEVNINDDSIHGLALKKSLQSYKKQQVLTMTSMIPESSSLFYQISNNQRWHIRNISERIVTTTADQDAVNIRLKENSSHINLMGLNIELTSNFGFFLRDLKLELSSRMVEELMILEKSVNTIGLD
jgi:hypothetical protein